MKKCPFCAEEIQSEAIRCKHCGGELEDAETSKAKVNKHPNYGKFTILSLLLPVVGLILGIVLLTKQRGLDKKLGEHLIAVSILFSIIWGAVWVMFVRSVNERNAEEIQQIINQNQRELEAIYQDTLYNLDL